MWLASAERKWTLLFKLLLLRSSASAPLLNKHLQFILSFEEIYEFLHWCGVFLVFFFGLCSFFFFFPQLQLLDLLEHHLLHIKFREFVKCACSEKILIALAFLF